jgi:PAS domain S-box-containing protein
MVAWYRRLLELPAFENEEAARSAVLLRLGLALGFGLNLLFLLVIALLTPQQIIFQLTLLAGLLLEIAGFLLLKQGHIRFSAWLIVLCATLLASMVLFVLGPNYESNFIPHLVVMLFAGLILGSRSVPLVGALILSSWIIGLIGYEEGWLPGYNQALDFANRLVADVAIFLFSGVCIFWMAYKTEQTLAQSRETNRALQQALDDLQYTSISRGFLDNILQSMAEMLIVLDMEGRIVMVNESLLNCLGYEQDELIGQFFNQVSMTQEPCDSIVENLLSVPPFYYAETTYRAKDGGQIAILLSCHPLVGKDTPIQGAVCVAQDITEQKLSRQVALDNEKRFLAVAEASQVAVIMASRAGILYANSAVERIIGCTKADIRLLDLSLLFPEEDRGRLVALFRNMVQAGADPIQLEIRIINRQQQEKWLYCSAATTELDNEQTLVITALDISERKRAEVEQKHSEALKSAFLEASLDAFILIEQDGTIIEFNPAAEKIFGYARLEAVGSNIARLIAPDDNRETVLSRMTTYYPDKEDQVAGQRFEIRAARNDGTQIPIELTVSAFRVAGKTLFATYLRDITEQIRAKESERIADAEKERVRVLTEFVRDSSHDFRTPLASINTSLYLMQRSKDEERRREYAAAIAHQTARLEKLIEGMITMVQLDGESKFDRQSIDLNGLIRDVCVRIRSLAAGKSQEITMNLSDDLPHIYIAGHEIGRVLAEILENAVLFTGEGGEIVVETGRFSEDTVQVSIRDIGIGISQDDLPFIFNRFYRVDQARSSATGGVGLGLPIAQKIIQRHGGYITAESTLGKGSTFIVVLPIAQKLLF